MYQTTTFFVTQRGKRELATLCGQAMTILSSSFEAPGRSPWAEGLFRPWEKDPRTATIRPEDIVPFTGLDMSPFVCMDGGTVVVGRDELKPQGDGQREGEVRANPAALLLGQKPEFIRISRAGIGTTPRLFRQGVEMAIAATQVGYVGHLRCHGSDANTAIAVFALGEDASLAVSVKWVDPDDERLVQPLVEFCTREGFRVRR